MKQQHLIRFASFELCLDTCELHKHGTKVRLQRKPFYILSALLEQPGRVVTREELRARLWSADTFVDFESGLNTAANRLRRTLGDSAENPIYIETLARVGYRFIAPVLVYDAPKEKLALQLAELPRPERADASPRIETSFSPWHRFSDRKWIFVAMAALMISLVAAAASALLRIAP